MCFTANLLTSKPEAALHLSRYKGLSNICEVLMLSSKSSKSSTQHSDVTQPGLDSQLTVCMEKTHYDSVREVHDTFRPSYAYYAIFSFIFLAWLMMGFWLEAICHWMNTEGQVVASRGEGGGAAAGGDREVAITKRNRWHLLCAHLTSDGLIFISAQRPAQGLTLKLSLPLCGEFRGVFWCTGGSFTQMRQHKDSCWYFGGNGVLDVSERRLRTTSGATSLCC